MTDINFQPIFDYIDESNAKLKEEILTEVRSELRDVKTAVANLSGQVKQYHEEMLVSGHRIDRLEDWAKIVGEKIGVPITF
jgi:uncharacterized coiled-coil DUF342 family protein